MKNVSIKEESKDGYLIHFYISNLYAFYKQIGDCF